VPVKRLKEAASWAFVGPGEPVADEGEHLGHIGGVDRVEVHLGSRHRFLLGKRLVA
jgi:hypothetical protein